MGDDDGALRVIPGGWVALLTTLQDLEEWSEEHDASQHDASQHDASQHDASQQDASQHDASQHDASQHNQILN